MHDLRRLRRFVGAVTCVTWGGALAQAVAPGAVWAQAAGKYSVVSESHGAYANGRNRTEVRITYRATNVTAEEAFREVGRQAGLGLTVNRSAVRLDRRVSVTLRDEPLAAAVSAIAQQAGVQARVSPDGEAIMVSGNGTDAQNVGTIAGKVIDGKTKRPVAGATISLDGATKGVLTGGDGTFRISANAGERTVHVRGIGFTRQRQSVTVTEGQTTVVEFALEPSASVLNEVIVTGTVVATERKAIATPITVITAEELERRNITRIDQLLRGEIPGVLAMEQGTVSWQGDLGFNARSKVYSRGSASLDGAANTLKTYVDGVELLDPSYLGTLDPKTIERIEVITGPQAATIYGSGALGGVMQIFTKKGSRSATPELTLTMRYGMMQSNLSSAYTPSHDHGLSLTGGSGPDFSYTGTLSYGYTGQWQPLLFSRTLGGSFGISHARGPLVLSGSASLMGLKSGVSGFGGVAFGSPAYGVLMERVWYESGDAWDANSFGRGAYFLLQRTSLSSTQTLALNLDYQMASQWQHHLTLGRSGTRLQVVPQAPRFGTPSDTLYAVSGSDGQRSTVSYNSTFAPRVGILSATLTVGGSGSFGERTEIRGCKVGEAATSYIGCFAGAAPQVTTAVDDRNWGGFASARLGLFDQAFLTAGLRGERSPSYGREHTVDWTPTVGATYTVERGNLAVKLLGSYGSATRSPDPSYRLPVMQQVTDYDVTEYKSQAEAPQLVPEHSRGPQGGVEVYYGNLGSFAINHYVQNVEGLIGRVPVDSIQVTCVPCNSKVWLQTYQYQNLGAIKQQGWEATSSLNLGALGLKGTYSWNDSRVKRNSDRNPASGYRAGDIISGIPTHMGNLTVTYAIGGASVSWISNYVGTGVRAQGLTLPERYRNYLARLKMYGTRTVWSTGGLTQPGYVKSDLAFSQRLTPWATGVVNVTNVTNSFTSDMGDLFPALGRKTLIGVSIRPTRR